MKIINAFIIVFLLISVSFAQNKSVVADGNPPLTGQMVDRLVNLFEWSLDVEFTQADRSALQKQVAVYWQTQDEKSIKATLNMLAFEQNLSGASAEKKREIQPQVKQQMLETIRNEREDALNNLLLAIYEKQNDAGADSPAIKTGGASPAELAGRWQVRHGNSLTTQNVYSGAIGDANGMIAEYDIKADGRVIFRFFLSQNNYGCVTKIKTSKTGRAVVEGSRVTFVYDGGTTTSEDNCNAKYNYTKKLAAERETFDFNLKRENGKTQFCFDNGKLKDCAVKMN